MWKSLFLPLNSDAEACFASFLEVGAEGGRMGPLAASMTIMVVLKTHDIQFYDMSSATVGPQICHGIAAPSCASGVATCAAMFSADVLANCEAVATEHERIVQHHQQQEQEAGREGEKGEGEEYSPTNAGEGTPSKERKRVKLPPDTSAANSCSSTNYLCAVGSSTGRVNIFDTKQYRCGFQVTGEGKRTAESVAIVSEEAGRGGPAGFAVVVMLNDGSVSVWRAVISSSSAHLHPQQQQPQHQRTGPTFHCTELMKPSTFRRCHCMAASQTPTATLVFHGGLGYSGEVFVKTLAGEQIETTIDLPGAFSRNTVMAADGHIVLVARDRVVFSINFATKVVRRLFTAPAIVQRLHVVLPFAVAATEKGELILVLAEGSPAKALSSDVGNDTSSSEGVVAREAQVLLSPPPKRYFCYSHATPKSVRLDRLTWTIAVADNSGAVEIFELPKELLRRGVPAKVGELAQSTVIQCVMDVEESSSLHTAEFEEKAIVARYVVPEEAAKYCGAQFRLL